MDEKIVKINNAMLAIEKAARLQIKTDEDKLLVASALMAVTRNLYVDTLGPRDTAHIFATIVESFDMMEEMLREHRPTIHQEGNMKLLKDIWNHLKEWNEWGMKDWIKAGIIVIVVLVVLKMIILPGA